MQKESQPIIVQAPQLSREWFEARLGNVTGSMVSKTMDYYKPNKGQLLVATQFYALNEAKYSEEYIEQLLQYPVEYCLKAGVELTELTTRQNYRRQVVSERLNGVSMSEGMFVSKAMLWGQEQERYAKQRYTLDYGHQVEDAPLFLHPELMTGASPDGLVIDVTTGELGNIECKALEPWNHLYKIILANEVPPDYIPQIQHQMWINNRAWCDFVGYDPRQKKHLDMFVKRVERDEFYIREVLEPSTRRFLDECDRDERQFYAILYKRQGDANKNPAGVSQ